MGWVTSYFDVEAGDGFSLSLGSYNSVRQTFDLPKPGGGFFGSYETIPKADVAQIEIATEEKVKKLGGTVGWGLVGATLLGPAGLLAGLLLGGKRKKIVFLMVLKDGRKLLCSAEPGEFKGILGATV